MARLKSCPFNIKALFAGCEAATRQLAISVSRAMPAVVLGAGRIAFFGVDSEFGEGLLRFGGVELAVAREL
jgi:hypothetical protein